MNISDSTDFSSEENIPSESTDNAANEGELSLDQNGKLLIGLPMEWGFLMCKKELIKILASS